MSDQNYTEQALRNVLRYAERNDYKGYNKYDALDSKLLWFFSFGIKFIRLVYSQVVMRFPLNLRPLLLVPKSTNPKGQALFAMTYINLYKANGNKEDLEKAEQLLRWLMEHRSPHYPSACWGYQYPWQDVGFFAKPNLPNRVVTYFVCTAFMDAYELTGKQEYIDIVEEALQFMLNAPKVLYEDENMKCLSYVPDERINWVVMDVSALTGALCARVYKHRPSDFLYGEATKLIRYVADKQTGYGAWFYSHPPGAHTKMHDNYHTGYILDAILDYCHYSGNYEFMERYHKGLEYYKEHLFCENGAAKWMNNKIYPIDVHGSAQGIITFLKAVQFDKTYADLAEKIARWTINNMQHKTKGYFYYQRTKLYKKPFTLMHWSNGWMSRGLSELILSKHER